MNEKPPSTAGPGTPGLVARIRRAFRGEPWSRDEIQTFIESEVELDAEEKSMLTGVLEVSETQVRDVMVPRSQMVVIKAEYRLEEILPQIIRSAHSRYPVIGESADDQHQRQQAWHHKVVSHPRGPYLSRDGLGAEIGNYEFPAAFVPNLHYEYLPVHSRIPLGQWRAVAHSSNVFVVSSVIDELAHRFHLHPDRVGVQTARVLMEIFSNRLPNVVDVIENRLPNVAHVCDGLVRGTTSHVVAHQTEQVRRQFV